MSERVNTCGAADLAREAEERRRGQLLSDLHACENRRDARRQDETAAAAKLADADQALAAAKGGDA